MLNRNEFLKSIAVTGAAAMISAEGASSVMAEAAAGKKGETDLVIAMGGEPEEMFAASIKKMGGMGRFVKKGQKVFLKPNAAWDRTPEQAANTNPALVSAVIKACWDAGAADVIVSEHTCDEWRRSYQTSGIEAAVLAAGAKMLPANEESYYREVEIPGAKNLKKAKILNALLDADCWINIPCLKNHSGARMTIAMKNLMGIVWDRRFFHTNNLHQCIADMCLATKPVLNIVDAYRTLKSNGPKGRSDSDAVVTKAMFMSTDMVAVDTAATRFFNRIVDMPLETVSYLAMGEELGVGTMDLRSLNIEQVKL
ncbi:MAG: DUF362 domain-containing protein [Thermoguttaceae bacterium]|nr:DUF362 domain-containing protein [Thermoguttaceae bacterium]